ncbi:MAG: hypothetical protein JO249_09545 [Acidobacteria bacterium]|nr:hypothetical protein [Acidobacteriota bacterium]
MITPADDRRAIHCALHDPTADNLTVPSPALLLGLIPRSLWSFVSGARRRDPARPNHDQDRVGTARSLPLSALPSPAPHPNFSFGGAIANAAENPLPVDGKTIIENQPKGPGAQDFRALLAEIKELVA